MNKADLIIEINRRMKNLLIKSDEYKAYIKPLKVQEMQKKVLEKPI